jgi:hypothetical protein
VLFYTRAPRQTLLAGAGGGLLVGVVVFRELFKRRTGVGMKVR